MTGEEALAVPIMDEQDHFTVIGSGVIGVLVAKTLVEHGHTVSVLSPEGKPGLQSGDSTSAVAVGQFLPWVPEGELNGISVDEAVSVGRNFYADLAGRPHETGVLAVDNIEFVNAQLPWPSGLPRAMDTQEKHLTNSIHVLDPSGELVAFDTSYTFPSFSINVRKTLAFLADEAEKVGVKFKKAKVTHEDFDELDGVVINAAGVGGSQFDETLTSQLVKGHTFRLAPHKGAPVLKQAISVDDLIIMPREDSTIVCGALYLPDPEKTLPEEAEATKLIERLSHLVREAHQQVEGLDPQLFEHSDILSHSAGLRVKVGGKGEVRVAPDESNERLLHAYGFSGIGWSVGPHFADKIVDLAKRMHSKNTSKGIKNE